MQLPPGRSELLPVSFRRTSISLTTSAKIQLTTLSFASEAAAR